MSEPLTLDGVCSVLPTAFRSDGELDLDGTSALVRATADAGVSGLTVLGVMGEAAELSEDENAARNDRKAQTFLASAFHGTGVVETLKAITMTVFKHVRDGGLANLAQSPSGRLPSGSYAAVSPVPHPGSAPAPVTGARPMTTGNVCG